MIIAFNYAPISLKGELVKRYEDEIIPEPLADMVLGVPEAYPDNTDWRDDNYGRTMRMTPKGMELKIGGRYLYKLHDVVVSRDSGGWYIVMAPGVCALEACPWRSRYIAGSKTESHVGPIVEAQNGDKLYLNVMDHHKTVVHATEPGVFHNHSWEGNYFHHVIDSLPRCWAEEEEIIPVGTKWADRSHNAVHYDTLWFPSFWPPDGFAPEPIRWLRKRLKKNPTVRKKTALYFSREDAKTRRCLNEHAVLRVLDKMGLSVFRVRASEMSFPQQIDLAESSQIIIGPHGSAITNSIFGSNAGVIEFLPSEHAHIVFQYLNKWAGNFYARILVPGPKDCDMEVNLDAVEIAVKEALKATA